MKTEIISKRPGFEHQCRLQGGLTVFAPSADPNMATLGLINGDTFSVI